MSHPRTVPGWSGSLQELANHIENLHYEQLAEFFSYLQAAFRRRVLEDKAAKRYKLSFQLSLIHNKLLDISLLFDEVKRICGGRL